MKDLKQADYFFGMANEYKRQGRIDEAIIYYQKAIELNPKLSGAYHNLGNILQELGRLDDAMLCFKKSVQLTPYVAITYNNLGNIFQEKGLIDDAIACYQKALQLDPNLIIAYNNLGIAFGEKGQHDEAAIACFRKALEINPQYAETLCQLAYYLKKSCLWQELDTVTAKLDILTRKALDIGTTPAETPFISIIRNADPFLNFAVAKALSSNIAKTMSHLKINFSFDSRRRDKTRNVIGYLSNDFRNHATAHLMLNLFRLHNREEFEIICYSYGQDDRSSYRSRIQQDCDKFIDISSLSNEAAARCIYENQVDILIDLKGYTRGNRIGICALRPVPVQVSYLGFPGSTGADFFDYIITDKIVTPEDHTSFYSEKFVYMPHCYQVNDYTQPISNKNCEKRDFGLPEGCFVFSSFNDPYKVDPVIFAIWMCILTKVPDSILWLMSGNNLAEANLKREAEAKGIQTERIVFADMLPKDKHLARLKFADLALDTRVVNGHTTTSDALWAGVPVITLQGSHFASRVSSSILSAIGLSELITHSLEEYEDLAVQLALTPEKLGKIRQSLAKNRLNAPLFDTPRFVRNLEHAYKAMYQIFSEGEPPRQIEVLENTT